MEYYITNRDLIKNLSINTGTTSSPVYTPMCTTSEVGLDTDMEKKDFFVFCDALKRQITTGASVTITGTVKIDVNNVAVMNLLGDIHTLIADGEIAQFNNKMIQFDLLTSVSGAVLEYTTYQAVCNLSLSDLGGAAEDESEFAFEMTLNGTANTISA